MEQAIYIVKKIGSFSGPIYHENASILLFSVCGILFLLLVESKKEFFDTLFTLSNNNNWFIQNLYYCFLIIAIILAGVFDGGEFIYFQF